MPFSDPLRPNYDFALADLGADRGSRGHVFRAITPGSRVLDAGCDTGRFGQALIRERGCHVDGVEQSPEAAEQARARLERVFVRSVEEPEAFADLGPYDVILFLDVLEHLRDPWQVVGHARNALRPGGRLLAVVPNVAHVSVVRRLMLGRFDYLEHGTMDRTHLRWFTQKSIRECFEGAGLTRVEVTPIPLIPHLDDTTPLGAPAARALVRVLPNAFAGSFAVSGYSPVA